MDLGVLSLVLFLIAIVCSMVLPVNIGIIAIAFTFILKVISGVAVAKFFVGFPQKTFMLIFAIMTMFTYAQVNGTMEKITRYLLRFAKGKIGLVPIIMFFIAFFVAGLGPGAYSIGMTAPIAMAISHKAKIPPLLMITMVGTGISAAGLSPFAVAGTLAAEATKTFGAGNLGIVLFVNGLIGNIVVAVVAYIVFGGLKLWKGGSMEGLDLTVEPFTVKQKITALGILALMVSVLGFKVDISIAAMFITAVYALLSCAPEKDVWKNLPWSVIVMLFGVSMLVAAAEEFGGIKLFVAIVSKYSTAITANAFLSFFPGLVSAYAASSPTMLTFLPLVPGLAANTGASVTALCSSIVFSAFVVDCSPFSTIGAVCLANLDQEENYNKSFKGLLIWAIGLIVMAPIISTVLFGLIMYR
jgi:di/tricarboxylate transporter